MFDKKIILSIVMIYYFVKSIFYIVHDPGPDYFYIAIFNGCK